MKGETASGQNKNHVPRFHLDRLSPITFRVVSDQFRRAAMSIPLNIAEGAGRFHPREKKQFYWVARGSCFECVPIVDLCLKAEILDKDTREELRDELERVAKMLTGLIRSVDEKK